MKLYQEEVMEFEDAAKVVANNNTVGRGAGGRRLTQATQGPKQRSHSTHEESSTAFGTTHLRRISRT